MGMVLGRRMCVRGWRMALRRLVLRVLGVVARVERGGARVVAEFG